MTASRRIILNILATYGRSLLALACGVFSSRWVLMALGQIDYGLFGLIGGLTIFISFINSLLSGTLGRFYAYSIGAAKNGGAAGLEECRRWFNTAVLVHIVVPVALVAVGYPIGEYAVRHWLTIPTQRVEVCVWVLRFACAGCLVGMMNVPFSAMYTAKQYIAELTVYSVLQTVANVCLAYYMISHPGEWLKRYSLCMCLMFALPQVMICIRAMVVFPECRINWTYMFDVSRLRRIGSFSGWNLISSVASLLRGQGVVLVVNKFFGPAINASMSVANTVNIQANSLSASLIGAFNPAITTACGSGDFVLMRKMAYRACKFSSLLSIVFFLPLTIEIHEVMVLWLKEPPRYAELFCVTMMWLSVVESLVVGHEVVMLALGRIALYRVVLGSAMLIVVPLAVCFVLLGLGVYGVCLALAIQTVVCSWGRILFTRKMAAMGLSYWCMKILLPMLVLVVAACAVGMLPSMILMPSVGRIFLTVVVSELVILPSAYGIVLDADERMWIGNRLAEFWHRFGGRGK